MKTTPAYKKRYKKFVEPFLVKNNVPKGYVTAAEACKILKLSRERVRQLRFLGILKFKVYKRSFLYELKSLIHRKKNTTLGRPYGSTRT